MKISTKQIEAIMALPGSKRYAHFIKVVADQGCAWGLYSDGWALAATSDGKNVFPVWPAKDYAELCASGPWDGYVPREIEVHDLINGLIPSLKVSETCLGVFYTPNDKGVLPSYDQFLSDLQQELSRVE